MNIKKNILATLTYFDMFDYPLRKREIFLFLGQATDSETFDEALYDLTEEAAIYRVGEFYSLHDNYALCDRRLLGNLRAAGLLEKAEKAASLISAFPFVRGVAVSGSLSKYFADEHADIDFFIITAANRLWIARSFLHAFKKMMFLINRQHYFCMNYFVDENTCCILEKNIYTATEVATILPMRGNGIFKTFFSANGWTKKFLPNNYMHAVSAKEPRKTWTGLLTEKLLNNRLGSGLDILLMKLTVKSWKAKTHRQKRMIKVWS